MKNFFLFHLCFHCNRSTSGGQPPMLNTKCAEEQWKRLVHKCSGLSSRKCAVYGSVETKKKKPVEWHELRPAVHR